MHTRDHDHLENGNLRPKGAHVDERSDALLWQAAATDRPDALGRGGLAQIQRSVGNAGVQRVADEERSPVLDVITSGGGRPLDPPVRADMEARLGHDFSDVKVHTDDSADHSAKSVKAHAYTIGSNIVFQRDAYDPSSRAGRTTLAHELTHVVQQRNGPVDGTPSGEGVSISDPSDRFEREAAATAEQTAGSSPDPHPFQAALAADARANLQRDAVDDPATDNEPEQEDG